MVKEYGGFLPMEVCGTEYYHEDTGLDIARLNAARYAIVAAFRDGMFQKIWIPTYLCQSVADTLRTEKIKYEEYSINESFLPVLPSVAENECILITNYYGMQGDSFYSMCVEKYKNIIFDNTQAFFARPVLESGIYNVYSPRKFVGVSDGAYLISKKLNQCDYQEDYSFARAFHILQSTEEGTNKAYHKYLESEADISQNGIRKMSKLTNTMLMNVDYGRVHDKRQKNYARMNERLRKYNLLQEKAIDACPMVYPLYTETNEEQLRSYLIERKVYIPQWWKWVLGKNNASFFERKLSIGLYPLPIDQRYSEMEIDQICTIVETGLKRIKNSQPILAPYDTGD